MDTVTIKQIAILRMIVGYLGEKDQKSWWPSSFLSRTGAAFLTPVFPKTSLLARVTGASASAQLTHDEYIGVGDVFHLFRLTENIEHDISQLLAKDNSFEDCIVSEEEAIESLESMSSEASTKGVGPLLLGGNELSSGLIRQMASAYLTGFQNNQAVYPYYRSKV